MAKGANGSAKSLSDRDKKLLYIAGAVLLLVLAYVFGFQKMQESRSTLEEENVTLETEVNKLNGMVAKKAEVEAKTEYYKEETENFLEKYPTEVRTQTAIAHFNDMEKQIKKLRVETETFTMNQIFFQNGLPASLAETTGTSGTANTAGGEGSSNNTGTGHYTGYRSDVVATFKGSYETLKKVIDFVNNRDSRMTISELSVSNENGENNLQCSMTVSMYSVVGIDKEYTDPQIPAGIQMHKSNIFSSKN